MPNHFHLLIYTDERVAETKKQGGLLIDPLTNGFRKLLSGYARFIIKLITKQDRSLGKKPK
jgi:hypothetical protein